VLLLLLRVAVWDSMHVCIGCTSPCLPALPLALNWRHSIREACSCGTLLLLLPLLYLLLLW
jgi:hypothetical protein